MKHERFRATRGPNVIMDPDPGLPDWGVYDSAIGTRGKLRFTKAFAIILAESMNYAYDMGRRGI